jgi:hypothetical protein
MRFRGGIVRAVAAAAAMPCLALPVLAQPTDLAVKAAFLPRFARYVTWPPAAMPRGADPFALCVIGGDPFGVMLDDAARTQLIDGRRIVVRRMDSAVGADGCQIAFVSGGRTGQLIAAIGRRPVLTVTDAGSGQRGIIHFAVVGGHVRFFIDQSEAARQGLGISSRLLALAVGVSK